MKIKMSICIEKNSNHDEKFSQFIEDRRLEGWILVDVAYRPYESFTEYKLDFERLPANKQIKDLQGYE